MAPGGTVQAVEEHQQRRGGPARLLFNPLTLRFMFVYRAWVTRRMTRPV